MKSNIKQLSLLILGLVLLVSCGTENLNPTLAQDKPVEGGITKVDNLASVLRGALSRMTGTGYYGRDLIATNEVRSDNCFSNGNSGRFSTQAEFQYNANTGYMWDDAYGVISALNIIINQDVTKLAGDQNLGKHIQGQAYTLRALAHFDLLKAYGQQHTSGGNLGVVIQKQFAGASGVDWFLPRSTVDEVKAFIYQDLTTGYGMMNSTNGPKVFVNKFAAKAIESRVAIYFGEWTKARDAAQAVVNSGWYSIASAGSYVSNWATKQASNSIFELAFSTADTRGSNGLGYIYRFPTDAPAGYGDVEVVSGVINIFHANDVRRNILGYQDSGRRLRNMRKYPDTANSADNVPLIRYEEVVLNLAEALFEINNADANALTHLNSIATNRNAPAHTVANKANIILERRKELMFEGFRFDDLMRTGASVVVLGSNQNTIQTLTYPNDLFAYPIPIGEINANSNMVQNKGY